MAWPRRNPGTARWLGWPADRKNLAHICCEHCAIVRSKARQRAPLVPGNCQRFSQRPTSKRETDDSQPITVALELRRNDRNAVSRLGECQQGVRAPAFELGRWLQSRHPAGCVECAAKSKATVHEQQRELVKVRHLHGAIGTKRHRRMTNC